VLLHPRSRVQKQTTFDCQNPSKDSLIFLFKKFTFNGSKMEKTLAVNPSLSYRLVSKYKKNGKNQLALLNIKEMRLVLIYSKQIFINPSNK